MKISFFFLALTLFSTQVFAVDARFCKAKIRNVLVVEGISSGRFLAPELRAQGYAPFHLHASTEHLTAEVAPIKYEDYVEDLVHDGNLENTLAKVSEINPQAIIAGADVGVPLADYLSEKLGLLTNGSALTGARTNKYLMIEQLRKSGVRVAEQKKSSNLSEILAWARNRNKWPVVIKPTMSAGTDGVVICNTEAEIKRAFNSIIGKVNPMANINSEVLAQEYIPGREYAVNAVSSNGKHIFTDIWQYNRHEIKGAATIYDEDILLNYNGIVQKALRQYIEQVLNALNITVGPSHAEVKMTPEGPVLIEIGARLAGASMPRIVKEATDSDPVGLTIDAYLHPDEFLKHKPGYTRNKNAVLFFLQPTGNGGTMSYRQVPKLLELKGMRRYDLVPEGKPLTKPQDANSVAGVVEFLNEDMAAIEKSIAQLREWERQGLFETP